LSEPNRHLSALLHLAGILAAQGRFEEALRYADRARRLQPANPTIVELAARLLLRLGRPADALAALAPAPIEGDARGASVIGAEVLLALGDALGAARALEALLRAFATDTPPGLADVAEAVCRHARSQAAGWVGLAADGAVVGALDQDLTRFRVVATPDERRAIAQSLPPNILGVRALDLAPSWRLAGRVGRAQASPDRLSGSATLGWAPQRIVHLVATDEAGVETHFHTQPRPVPSRGLVQRFTVQLAAGASEGVLRIEALSPDGERLTLSGSPLAPAKARRAPRAVVRAIVRAPDAPSPRVAVIVVVHTGFDRCIACVNAVLTTTDPDQVALIVVNDASPEPDVSAALQTLAAEGRITLLVNPRNLGLAASINRAMALHPDRDAVWLDAHAEVHGDWLDRLRRAAASAPAIATVTPWSNQGSIMAYGTADDEEGADLDDRFFRLHAGKVVMLPTGSGPCLYVRRAAWAETGPLEEAPHGPGHGEERDFCRRAGGLGWRHAGAADVFVRHAGRASFASPQQAEVLHQSRWLRQRHAAYDRALRGFVRRDPLGPLRRAIDEARWAADASASVLIITLARGGGVERHVAARAAALQDQGARVIDLRPAGSGICRLRVSGRREYAHLRYRLPDEFEDLVARLRAAEVRKVEIHHMIDLDPAVLDLPGRLGAPYELFVHDYSWVCPRITFIAEGRYCGEPAEAVCEQCIAIHGAETGETISVAALRRRSARVFTAAERVIAPSRDAAMRIGRYFPDVEVLARPWETEPFPADLAARPPRGEGERVRVAVLGALGKHKGLDRLLEAARDAQARDLPLEFVVIGHTEDDPALFETGRVFVTGRFEDGESAALLAREGCDVALAASIWPETWCYALTDLLASGLPLVALDFGAVGERLRGVGRATLLPVDSPAVALNDALATAARPGPVIILRGGRYDPRALDTLAWRGGGWARLPGDDWIEAFQLTDENLRCSAILAEGQQTAWAASNWCVDPSGRRPLMGFAITAVGALARTHRCAYDGVFSSGAKTTAADGAPCQSPFANDPLVALRVHFSPIGPATEAGRRPEGVA
jgi:GT2 family glycosyltransferase/glycosyltransferase involved in cell wall biosynthesis